MDGTSDPLNLLLGGEDAPKKKVRRRRERDPAAPKKPASAMSIFIEATKPAMKTVDPSLPTMECNRRLQKEWQELSLADREEFTQKAHKDKARYEAELLEYEAPAANLIRPTKSGTRLQKDPRRPKKPKTAYLCFADYHRTSLANALPGAGVSVLAKKIAEKWRAASAEEKAEFIAMAEEDKGRFFSAMKEYKPSAAYKQAKETFKSLKKSGGKRPTDVLSPPPLVTVAASSGQTPSSLEEQNSKLRALVQEQAARIDVQAKAIDALQQGLPLPAEAAAIVSLVTSHPAASASAPSDLTTEPPAEPVGSIAAKPSTAPSAVGPGVSLARGSLPHPTASDASSFAQEAVGALPNDESHYFEWTQKVLGANGEKASPAMKKILKEQGAGALAEMLKKKYAAEHKARETTKAKPKRAPEPTASEPEPSKHTRRG